MMVNIVTLYPKSVEHKKHYSHDYSTVVLWCFDLVYIKEKFIFAFLKQYDNNNDFHYNASRKTRDPRCLTGRLTYTKHL